MGEGTELFSSTSSTLGSDYWFILEVIFECKSIYYNNNIKPEIINFLSVPWN